MDKVRILRNKEAVTAGNLSQVKDAAGFFFGEKLTDRTLAAISIVENKGRRNL